MQTDNTDSPNFLKLTPETNVELSVYDKALDYVFKNDDVRNVAISGAYCSGKSSVLKSYENKHNEKKFIHISLAHFPMKQDNLLHTDNEKQTINHQHEGQENAKERSQNSGQDVQINVLEGKILNQLIHQIPADRIPQTNFKIKRNIPTRDSLIWVVLISIFVLGFVYFKWFDLWQAYVLSLGEGRLQQLLSQTIEGYFRLLSGGILAFAVFFGILQLVKLQQNKKILRKLSLQGNEIEIFESSENSYFDKYLNEVLYLFKNSGAAVIVFEDMDRFNIGLIYERLRELNTLINVQREPGTRSIKFFYLLRDDMFESKDRVKFFDYIIPIVPVVDSSNSYSKLSEYLMRANILPQFDTIFLKGISLYIDDMRILKNICNEFQVYYRRLNVTELNYNKMLAIITYKNLFPSDFSDLQNGRGFVFTLFDLKETLIKERLTEIHEQIQTLRKDCESLQQVIEQENKNSGQQSVYSIQLTHKRRELYKAQEELEVLQSKHLSELLDRNNTDEYFSNLCSTNELRKIDQFERIKGNDYFALLKYLVRNGYIMTTE